MALTTDLDNFPYWDDYDEKKKYHKVLFRPTTAVQARELTQLQTILQNQIERFGNHIFKDGSVVRGCSPTAIPNFDFVRVEDNFLNNNLLEVTKIDQTYLLVGESSGVRAVPIVAKKGLLVNYPDTNRFYVKYITTGNNEKKVFDAGETILVYNINQLKLGTLDANNIVERINVIGTTLSNEALGKGYGISIEEGIAYHKGFFQLVNSQTVLVKDYDQDVGNYLIGFDSIEEIVTEDMDETLADNALGYPNENAPGAHRLKLEPYLVAKNRTDINETTSFFAVFEFSNVSGELIINRNKNGYDQIGEVLSNRTFEESGDYVTKTFTTDTQASEDPKKFNYVVSSGVGYVRGNRVEYLSSRKIETDRAIDTKTVSQQNISLNYGSYVYVKECSGTVNFSSFPTVNIYDGVLTAVSSSHSPNTAGKNLIGTAKVKQILLHSGSPGAPDTVYRLYISDIQMISGKSFTQNAKSFLASGSSPYSPFYADILLNASGKAVLQENAKTNLVFPVGKNAIKTLRSANGSVNETEFYFRTSSAATMQTDGRIAVTVASPTAGGVEELAYSVGSLTDVSEAQFSVTVSSNVSSANISGTVSVNSTNNLIGHGSTLQTRFAPGEIIKIYGNTTSVFYRTVVSVNTTILEMSSNAAVTNGAANFAKHFPAGYNIPLNSNYSGNRTINITSPTTFDIDVDIDSVAALESTTPVVVQYRMRRKEATQAKKEINKNRFVKLHSNAAVSGAWNLGLPDVHKIRKVYSGSTYANTGTDVTNYFILDNGQRQDYYDHAKLVIKPEYQGSLSDAFLTVELDHFTINTTNGVGFLSVDSYPIDDANTANNFAIQTEEIPTFNFENTTIKLRDAIDFRPYKVATANSASTIADATENPTTTTSFVSNSARYLAEPDTNFQANIEYYLGRKDLVTININGGLGVVKGTPSEFPRKPQNNADAMVIALVDVPPYPSLTSDEAEEIGKPEEAINPELYSNRVYTMEDIGVLDQRIENLEYYTSLLALELKAKDLAVLDENGNNRFKNGIFVDPMTSYDFHDATSSEYKFTLDITNSYGRSTFFQKNIDLNYLENISTGIRRTGNYLTRPYTEELLIFQPFATKFRNNAQDLWRWNGIVSMFPEFDINTEIRQGPTGGQPFTFEFRPFMNSRTIGFFARGMKPSTRIYPYFDNTPVSQHCAPAAINTAFGTTLDAAITAATRTGRPENAVVRTNALGSAISTNANGQLLGVFRIPPDTFRVGDRSFRLVDVDSLILGEDAILTEANTTFTGFNIAITFPPPPPPPPPGIDPLAQSFIVDAPEGQSGIFVTKIELFFRKKDPNLGLEIVMVGMENGVPNFRDVKGVCTLTSGQVLVSDDASLPTTAVFDFPIYLPTGKDYAFYIRPEGNSPEYQMWVCEIGDNDVTTGVQVFRNPYAGDLFRSSNETTWTAIPTEDIKFNLYVANFEVGTGEAYFCNESDDFLTIANITINNPTKPIAGNQEVYRITSLSDISIVSGYSDLEGYVQDYYTDGANTVLVLNNSKGAFRENHYIGIFDLPQQGNSQQCNSSTLIAKAQIVSVDNPIVHSLIPKILTITPTGTSVNLGYRGTSNSGIIENDYNDVVSHTLKELTDYERRVYSASNEALASLPKTFNLKASLNNSNKYVSPILDITTKKIVCIENIINNTFANEETNFGSSLARYISKPVTLADGQDAEDFLLYLTGYRPVSTDILVYVKFLSGDDPSTLDSKIWTKLDLRNPTLRSSSVNNVDYKEFVYGVPASAPVATAAFKPVGSENSIRYVDSGGAIYQLYKSFVVKIVLTSSNKIYVPKVNDIRAIALQL